MKDAMKILITTAFPEGTGSWEVMKQEARLLLQRGYNVHVAFCDNKEPRDEIQLPCPYTVIELNKLPGLIKAPRAKGLTFGSMECRDITLMQGVIRSHLSCISSEFKPDLVITHHLWNISAIVAEMNVPYIVWAHGPDLTRYHQWDRNNRFQQWANLSASKAQAILAPSQDMSQRVWQSIEKQSIVLPLGYDSQYFYSTSEPKSNLSFTTVGAVHESKGLSMLIEAFRNFPELSLTWVGEGEVPDNAPMNVNFVGRKSHKELGSILRESVFFISGSESESFGLALLEAIACGCIPVVQPLPAFKEICGEERWKAVKYFQNTDTLRNILEEVSGNPPILRELESIEWAAHAQTFTWESHGDHLHELIQSII